MKKLSFIKRDHQKHWVGDGFPVQNVFSYRHLSKETSPFLLFDYAGPAEFQPTAKRRGVGEHPHRGFETVTIVYHGEVEHRDSSGGGGRIGPGDVQWMTAASGLVHEEFHGKNFAEKGGKFEMIQLWVNLPKKFKYSAPKYQNITNDQIPELSIANNAGKLRIIAGERDGTKGPAQTFTPVQVWDAQLNANHLFEFNIEDGHGLMVFVRKGSLKLEDGEILKASELASFEKQGSKIKLKSLENSEFIVLSGEPIDEPVVGHGPFVMNSVEELEQAFKDFQRGQMGSLK